MDLQAYISSERGNGSALASHLEIPLTYLSQMASGNRAISPERANAIEIFTAGKVARMDCRPDDYWLIWPDLPAPTDTAKAA